MTLCLSGALLDVQLLWLLKIDIQSWNSHIVNLWWHKTVIGIMSCCNRSCFTHDLDHNRLKRSLACTETNKTFIRVYGGSRNSWAEHILWNFDNKNWWLKVNTIMKNIISKYPLPWTGDSVFMNGWLYGWSEFYRPTRLWTDLLKCRLLKNFIFLNNALDLVCVSPYMRICICICISVFQLTWI